MSRGFPRRLVRALLSLGVTLALLVGVALRVDPRAVWSELASAAPGWLLLAAALGPVQIALSAERWRLVSEALGLPLGRGRAFREFGLSALLNQLLPGGLAGDVVRAWRTAEEGGLTSARAVMVDRVLGFAVLLGTVAGGLCLWPLVHGASGPDGALWVVGALLAALAALLLVPAPVWVVGVLGSDLRAVLCARAGRLLGLSVGLVASFLLGFALCAEAVGTSLGASTLTAIPLVLLSMSVPLGWGGFGLREATAALLLPQLGVPVEAAVAISAAYGLTALVGSLPGALGPLWDPLEIRRPGR